MKTLAKILLTEQKAFFRWATERRFTFAVIILSVGAIITGITVLSYRLSGLFFANLRNFGDFGDMTALYVIASASAVSLWFIAASTAVVFAGGGDVLGKELRQVLVLPIRPGILMTAVLLRALTVSLAVSAIVFLPVIASYLSVFSRLAPLPFFFTANSYLALIIAGESLGVFSGLALVFLIRRLGRFGYPVLFLIFMFSTLLLLRILFPPELSRLFDADPADFPILFSRLPLIATDTFPLWIARVVTGQSAYHLAASVLASLLSLAAVWFLLTGFFRYFVSLPRPEKPHPGPFDLRGSMRHPVARKDLALFVRSPAESGYAAFLMSIALFFFAMVYVFRSGHGYVSDHLASFGAFSLAWILFFAMTFFTRSVFPLIAREGAEAWTVFTAGISRHRIFTEKLSVSLFWAALWSFGSLVVVFLVFKDTVILLPLVFLTLFTVPLLSVLSFSLGSVHPNFRDALDPERLSTTGMGLISVFSGMLLVAGATLIFYLATADGSFAVNLPVPAALAGMVLLPLGALLVARRAIGRYVF